MTTGPSRRLFWLSALAAFALGAATASASAGPFSDLAGSWSGGGHILLANGAK